MDDVLMINGEWYQKITYLNRDCEATIECEQFEIMAVMQQYTTTLKTITLRLSYPLDMQIQPGDKITISKEVNS